MAKKFNSMYKNYRKFSVRFLNFDPDLGEIINHAKEIEIVVEADQTMQEESKKEEEVKV